MGYIVTVVFQPVAYDAFDVLVEEEPIRYPLLWR